MTLPPDLDRLIDAGREALAEGRWAEARAAFRAAANVHPAPAALEGLSWTHWWQGDQAATIDARERAGRGYHDAGDARGAARMAAWLASDHLDFAGDDALAATWLERAAEHAQPTPVCPERALIALLEADISLAKGEPQPAAQRAAEMVGYVRHLSDTSLEVVGMAIRGSALVAAGSVDAGVAQLDEAAALAVRQQSAHPVAAGWALCRIVATGAELGDWSRATQWCNTMRDVAARLSARHLAAIGRTAHGHVLTTTGNWAAAERELTSALRDLQTARPALSNLPAARLGTLRMRQGRTDEAQHLFEAALPLPQALLGAGELALHGGGARAAADAAERVLTRLEAGGPLARMPAFELLARARAALREHDAARHAAAAVERDAADLGTPYKRGRAMLVVAEVRLAAGVDEQARRAAEEAAGVFDRCAAPYDAACARLLHAAALHALGDAHRAASEQQAALQALGRLGVAEDEPTADLRNLSPREVAVLRLLAQGLSDMQIAQRLFLSADTVQHHVDSLAAKLRLGSREATVEYASRAGLV